MVKLQVFCAFGAKKLAIFGLCLLFGKKATAIHIARADSTPERDVPYPPCRQGRAVGIGHEFALLVNIWNAGCDCFIVKKEIIVRLEWLTERLAEQKGLESRAGCDMN